MFEMTCAGSAEAPQNWQSLERGAGSMTSSPVITQERVMGSLRSSMAVRRTKEFVICNW
jgi:hypothetical protein